MNQEKKKQCKNPIGEGKNSWGKNLNENWLISTVLRRVCFALQSHSRSYVYMFFGKEQYMFWGGRTVVQADLYMYLLGR